MKILFVINEVELRGGATNSFLTILDNLPGIVEQAYVLMPYKGTLHKEFLKRKISVWAMDYQPVWTKETKVTLNDVLKEWSNIKCAWNLSKRLIEKHIDIVYTNSGILDVGAMAAFFAGKRHIWHQREFIHKHFKQKYIFEWKDAWLLRHSDIIITISKCLMKEMKERYHIKNGIVFRNCINRDMYFIQREDLFAGNVLKCLVAGNIYEGKHQMDAVKAIGKLAEKNNAEIELYLAGGGYGEYMKKIAEQIKMLGMQKKIHLLKYEEDIRSLRKNMDIEISCSQWEAFGRTVIEGMMGGLLVIGAESGATCELIRHKRNGLLYQPGNANDLAEKILWVYNHKAEARKIARSGQMWASKFYSDDHFGKDLERILGLCYR